MNEYRNYSDAELLSLLTQDNHAAFTEIYRRYSQSLILYSYRLLKNEEETQDLVQELFFSLWNKRKNLQITGSLSHYLLRSVRYRFLNLGAHHQVRASFAVQFQESLKKGSLTTESMVRERELHQQLEQAIATFPKTMAQVYRLSQQEGMTPERISEELHIAKGTVQNLLSKATKLLKDKLKLLLIFVFLLL